MCTTDPCKVYVFCGTTNIASRELHSRVFRHEAKIILSGREKEIRLNAQRTVKEMKPFALRLSYYIGRKRRVEEEIRVYKYFGLSDEFVGIFRKNLKSTLLYSYFLIILSFLSIAGGYRKRRLYNIE